MTDTTQGWLKKGFPLAYFIFPERETAIRILGDALSKLEVYRLREKKRTYWRHKHLKRKITRVIREHNDMLQWLIYLEAEKYEKEQEDNGIQTRDELVIRYVKHLVQITTPMSSFYVNIGLQRLLHNYTTAEARSLYELVTDQFPANEEYRKVKGILMGRLQERFANFLRMRQASRGELQFEPDDHAESVANLIEECLNVFMPWSSAQACWPPDDTREVQRSRDPRLTNTGHPNRFDSIETSRYHTFIHSPCLANLAKELGLDSPYQRLSAPRFFLSEDGDSWSKPPAERHPTGDLTGAEQRALVSRLDKEVLQRRQVQPERLRILVDGHKFADIDIEQQDIVQGELEVGRQLIEIWAVNGAETMLLAVHWIEYSDTDTPVPTEAAVEIGKTGRLLLKIIGHTSTSRFMLEFHPGRRFASWKKYFRLSAWRQFPAQHALVATAALMLVAAFAYRGETIRQRAIIESTKKELAQERDDRITRQQQLSSASGYQIASFRVPPDSIRSRGMQAQDVLRISLLPNAALVNLNLESVPSESRYRAKLKPFLEQRVVLEEDDLRANGAGSGTSGVFFPIPASLLSTNAYYVVTLDAIGKDGNVKHTQTFTFFVSAK